MDPYQVPKSKLATESQQQPKSLPAIYTLLAISFVFVLFESLVNMAREGQNFFDVVNYIFVLVWLGVLMWFGNDISRGRHNPKWLMLFLSLVVPCMAAYDYQGIASTMLNIGETICYLLIFAVLQKPEYTLWFKQ
ncbi:MAG: hypothetical protein ABW101_15055 [Candidatus Thiodiazotropha sp.]